MAIGVRKAADPGALVRQVYDRLRRDIAAGRFRPGEPLPRRLIARRFGVSATPVIEALVRLEQTGLVEAQAGQVARVRSLTLESIQSDYVLREAVEAQAVRLACGSATPAEAEELRRLGEAVDVEHDARSRARAAAGARLDSAFHRRIAELSRQPILVRELDRIALFRHFRRAWLMPVGSGDPTRQHVRLADLIARRDVAGADAEVRAHVGRGLHDECRAYQQRVMQE